MALQLKKLSADIWELYDGSNSIAEIDGTNNVIRLNGTVKIGTSNISTELAALDGVTATAAELNYVDVTAAGTAQASKAVVLDANKDIAGIRTLTLGTNGATGAAAGSFVVRDGQNPGTSETLAFADVEFINDITVSATQINTLVQGVAAGYKIARGTQAATATATIATGLTTITGYAVSSIGTTATAANNAALITSKASAGNLTIKRWKHTSAGTATFMAASVAGTVSFLAVGT